MLRPCGTRLDAVPLQDLWAPTTQAMVLPNFVDHQYARRFTGPRW